MILLPLLFSVALATSPIYISDEDVHDQVSPYLADYTRIDWRQCKMNDFKNMPFCQTAVDCKQPYQSPASFIEYDEKNLLNNDCSQGIQIRPISKSKWLLHVQFFSPGILYNKLQLTLTNTGGNKVHQFAECKYDPASGKVSFTNLASELQAKANELKLKLRESSYSTEGRMMCSFDIEEGSGIGVTAALKNIVKDGGLDVGGSTLNTILTHVVDANPYDKKIPTTRNLREIVDEVEAKSGFMLTNTELPSQANEAEFAQNFTFTKAVKDFSFFACTHHQARLVREREDGLYEVERDHAMESSSKQYEFKYHTLTDAEFENLPEADKQVGIACAVRACHSCSPPPPVVNCDGCTAPILKASTFHRDCPAWSCPGDMWVFYDGSHAITEHAPAGLRCANANQRTGWFRTSNGYGVTGASCAPTKDCRGVSPLTDTCASPDSKNCVQYYKGRANCTMGSTLRFKDVTTNEWTNLRHSLYCDFKTGTWYSGSDMAEEFNHTLPLKCEEIDEPLFSYADTMSNNGFLFALYGCAAVFVFLMIVSGCALYWYNRTRVMSRLHHLKTRPNSKQKRIFSNLSEVKNMPKLDQETFVGVIMEFQLYSIQERMDFVEHSLATLGAKVEIDQFLILFNHCIEMESDYRVWRLLAIGYKMILISLNQVNRSRVAMRLSEYLKSGADVLINRIGFSRTIGEDYSITEVRNMAFNFKLITNDRHTIQQLLEESFLFRNEEDISRRKMIYAFRHRSGNSQEEKSKDWDPKSNQPMNFDDPKKAKLVVKYGTNREHYIYGLCCGKDPDYVAVVLNKVILAENSTRAEIMAGFRASIEDCFDMRYGARTSFMESHMPLKAKMPVGSPEYAAIFDMFARYANIEFGPDDNWLIKFVYTAGSYTSEEKEKLPMAQMAQSAENGRVLLKKALTFVLKPRDPPYEPPGSILNKPLDEKPRTEPSQAVDPTTRSGKSRARPDSRAAVTSSQPRTSQTPKIGGGPDSNPPPATGSSAPRASGSGHRGSGSSPSGVDSTGGSSGPKPKTPEPKSGMGSKPEDSASKPEQSRPSQ